MNIQSSLLCASCKYQYCCCFLLLWWFSLREQGCSAEHLLTKLVMPVCFFNSATSQTVEGSVLKMRQQQLQQQEQA